LPIPEVVTRGARLSPFEDFQARTLSALSGLWAKLLYMAELRSKDGKYHHWGHSRVHGESRSQIALSKAHSELYVALLRTPVRDLVEEIEMTSDASDPRELVRKIADGKQQLVPENVEGGSPRHFSSIALAVRLVYEKQRASSHSAA
jgi:hypothetical protein